MSNKHYFYVAEVSSEEDLLNITPKLASMKFFEKLIIRIISPLRKEIEKSYTDLFKDLNDKNSKLEQKVSDLSEALAKLSKNVDDERDITNTLLADYNTKKASFDSKYKAAINTLYKLNLDFQNNVSTFGRANKLEIIQMLVNYLYDPNSDLLKAIEEKAHNDPKVLSILKDINDFNMNYKSDLINYLSSVNTRWEDCVLFPDEFTYNPSLMMPFNEEIAEGTPIYVVALGYQFPNSNSEKQLPVVFASKTLK